MGRISATDPGGYRGQRRLFGCQNSMKELETHSNHCQREDRAQACPCFLSGPSPLPCWRGVGMPRLEETVVSSCEVSPPGSWAPAAGPGLFDKRLGRGSQCVLGDQTWGVPTGMAWPGGGAQPGSSQDPTPESCRPGQPTATTFLLLDHAPQVLHASERAESRHRWPS